MSATLAQTLQGKKVGLALASGFFGFYHHAGVLSALIARGIRPTAITGNSAGAIVASMYAAGLEPHEIEQTLLGLDRKDFWDMQWPLAPTGIGLLAGERFARILATVLPIHGFAGCRIPLSVGVYRLADGRITHLEKGSLISAVRASCAVPYMFAPVEIAKERYMDGGFGEKTPLVPFLKKADTVDHVVVSYLAPRETRRRNTSRRGLLRFLPSAGALLADTPADERLERDRVSAALLREAGIPVSILAPEQLWMNPFSLGRAREAFDTGRNGAAAILDAAETATGGP